MTYFGCSKQDLHGVYPKDAMPVCEAGSTLDPVEDDGSKAFDKLYKAVQDGHTVRRIEGAGKKRK